MKGSHPDPTGFVGDPEKLRLLRKIDRRDETIIALRRRLAQRDTYIAKLEKMLGVVHRGDSDGRIDPKPLGESTPSSKILFKEKSPEEKQRRQGGAKPGHLGHGRRAVARENADQVRDIPCPDECPDCGGKLLDFGVSGRTLRDCAPPRYVTIRLDAHEGWCPHCGKKVSPPCPDDVLPHSATTVRCDAQTLADHYLHHMTVGTISRRSGLNRSTIHGKEHDLAEILAPCVDRILDDWRKAPVKAADETTWPCNGVPGYVYGFFSKDCALYRYRGTRSSSVAVEVFKGSTGTTTTDRFAGYDNTVPGKHQWCFEHIKRNFLELLKREPGNREYQKYIPPLVDLLKQAMKLRGQGLPLKEHVRWGEHIKKDILAIAATRVKDGALQARFDIFLEHPNKLWHWVGDPNIPAENNWAERCIRDTVIFRKTGFGSQGEAAMADREILQSVMETLRLRYEDPAAVLADALRSYKPGFRCGMSKDERRAAKMAASEKVADILFPRDERMKPKRE